MIEPYDSSLPHIIVVDPVDPKNFGLKCMHCGKVMKRTVQTVKRLEFKQQHKDCEEVRNGP